MLARMIPDAFEVRGDMNPDKKEELLLGFANGDFRAIVTKPKLAGFGVNWQHCAHAVFASISFSYEQHYQAVRRSHRFGQDKTVRNDIVISDPGLAGETVSRNSSTGRVTFSWSARSVKVRSDERASLTRMR